MAETEAIARMAQKVSDEVFGVFGWSKVGPVNQNWRCCTESHEVKTHPSDVVFYYDDPYQAERVFWNVDLKSYAASSVSKASIAGAVSSLAKSVECANVSPGWQTLYGDEEASWRCDGMLFIYNHDGAFDRDFPKWLTEIDNANFRLPAKRRMAILGPPDVEYLVNVAFDIVGLRGRQRIPIAASASQYWYPDLVRPKRREQPVSAATIEMLTGPWITLRIKPEQNGGKQEIFIWYREAGETVEEFKFFIDSLFRFQLLADSDSEISVRFVRPAESAFVNFERAKEQISSTLYGLAKPRLDRVRCESITQVVSRFSQVELGMEAR